MVKQIFKKKNNVGFTDFNFKTHCKRQFNRKRVVFSTNGTDTIGCSLAKKGSLISSSYHT